MTAPDRLDMMVVGAGWAGDRHARAIQQDGGARLAAVVDPDRDRARALAERHGDDATVIHTSLEEAERDRPGPDAMIICSPTAAHLDQAMYAVRRNIPCLVEKPFATTIVQAQQLATVAREGATVVMAAQLLRSMPMFSRAAELVAAGRIGTPVQVVERRLEDRASAHPWWQEQPGFLVAHWGSHTIDLVSHLFDATHTEVWCRAVSARFPGVADTFSAQIRFDTGLLMTSTMSMASRHQVHDLVVVGTDGTLTFDCYRTLRLDDDVVLELTENEMYDQGFARQLTAFLDAIRTGTVTTGTPESVVRSLAIVSAAVDDAVAHGIESPPPLETPAVELVETPATEDEKET